MPLWVIPLIQMLPQLIAEIEALINAVNAGKASSEQSYKLATYTALANGIAGAIDYHAKVNLGNAGQA